MGFDFGLTETEGYIWFRPGNTDPPLRLTLLSSSPDWYVGYDKFGARWLVAAVDKLDDLEELVYELRA